MRLTIDSFAWIEVIRGTGLGDRVTKLIDEAEGGYTPSIVLAEVAYRCLRDRLAVDAIRSELIAIAEASSVIPLTEPIAVAASLATLELNHGSVPRRRHRAGLADGIVLATARATQSLVLTGDSHFYGQPETIWLGH